MENGKKLKSNLQGKELYDMEKKLSEYQGEDRIISSKEMAEILAQQPYDSTIYETKIPALDRILGGGVEAGELILVSGPTGHGKTTLLMTITKNLTEGTEIQSVWFSFEVTPRQFFRKFDFKPPLFYLPAKITSKHLEWLEERILEAKVKYDAKVVFIDHLHFLFNLSHMRNTSLEIGDLVSKIKDIAITNNLVIFLIVHPEKRHRESTEDPHHDDIRDSGLIPQYADTAMMIWRVPNDYEPGMRKKKIRELHEGDVQAILRITKNRREGTHGYVRMMLQDGFFKELEILTNQNYDRDEEHAEPPKPPADLGFN